MLRPVVSQGMYYQFIRLLGEGANSEVWLAQRMDSEGLIQQTVAIKLLKSHEFTSEWRDEFASLVKVCSNVCVRVFGFDWIEGRPALILEWVRGVSLETFLKTERLTDKEWTYIIANIQIGLRDLALAGVHHGDLSPRNIMLSEDGNVRLLDFGWGNARKDGRALRATVEFAAPEVIAGASRGEASDLYSLGLIDRWVSRKCGFQPRVANYCQEQPELRKSSEFVVSDTEKNSLRLKIMHWHEDAQTLTSKITNLVGVTRRGIRWGLMVTLLTLAMTGASSQTRDWGVQPRGYVLIRSEQWLEVLINNRSVGFAPMDIPIYGSEVQKLVWRSAKSKGIKEIQLKKGERLVLSYQDFVK